MMIKMDDRTEQTNGHDPNQTMTCEEFQGRMPELFGVEIREHEHLKTCTRCTALLSELEYIAGMASLLLPVHEPGDSVWKRISDSLPQSEETVDGGQHS